MPGDVDGKGAKSGPLHGIRVLDLTGTLMGPYCTQIMADLGADVIKVEAQYGDTTRGLPPCAEPELGGMFMNLNRGKRSIVLNLKEPAGRDILIGLVERSDVFVHSMRGQAMRRLNLHYDVLQQIKPDLVYANLYGFGRDGPYADLPAYDDVIQAASGLAMLQGQLQNGEPAYLATAIADKVGGLTAVYAIIAALLSRARTGEGQEIEVPMFETLVAFVMTEHLSGAIFQPRLGEPVYPRIVATDRRPYRTRDGYIAVMIYNDKQWRSFFRAMNHPAWSEAPEFMSMTTRTEAIDSVYGKLAEVLLERTSAQWLELMRAAEIPAMELYTTEDLLRDEHLEAVGFWKRAAVGSGSVRYPGIPTRFSRTPGNIAFAAPRLGQDSSDILRELGLSGTDIDTLVARGIVGIAAPPDVAA